MTFELTVTSTRPRWQLFEQDNFGEWFPVVGEAYWDELRPANNEWRRGDGRWENCGRQLLEALPRQRSADDEAGQIIVLEAETRKLKSQESGAGVLAQQPFCAGGNKFSATLEDVMNRSETVAFYLALSGLVLISTMWIWA